MPVPRHVSLVALFALGFAFAAGCGDDEDLYSGGGGPSAGDGPQAADAGRPPSDGKPSAGTDGGGVSEAGPAPAIDSAPPDPHAGQVPVFIAQGKLGRTTVSCDDGHTWIANTSENPSGRCWDDTSPDNVECDHNPWSSLGVISEGTTFLATYGWGYPGVVRRSEDGIHWADVFPGHTFAGFAQGNGRVLAIDRAPFISTTGGTTGSWTQGGDVGSGVWNVRRGGFDPFGGGRFIITLESGDTRDVRLSKDDGATWGGATTLPAECAHWVSNVISGGGTTLIVQTDGGVCRTADGGDTWTYQKVADGFSSPALFADGAFVVWNGTQRFRSTDGATWQSTAGTPANLAIGAVAHRDNGTFVAVNAGWQVWYEKQQFYRSVDGITWEALPATAFVASHPITAMTFGWTKPSTECPLH